MVKESKEPEDVIVCIPEAETATTTPEEQFPPARFGEMFAYADWQGRPFFSSLC